LADGIYGDYNMDRSAVKQTKDQATWKRLIVRVISNNFARFDDRSYRACLETTFKHALHGVLAENYLFTVHSNDQLIPRRRLPTVM
jgi:hypothetical protein